MNPTPNDYAPPGELSTPSFASRGGSDIAPKLGAIAASLHGMDAVTHAANPPFALSMLMGIPGPIVYHALSEGLSGASVGKALLGLRVVREDGKPCGVGAIVLRELALYVDGFLFGFVAYSSMKKSDLQQRLGDHLAKTVVVAAREVAPSSARAVAMPIILGLSLWAIFTTLATYLTRFG